MNTKSEQCAALAVMLETRRLLRSIAFNAVKLVLANEAAVRPLLEMHRFEDSLGCVYLLLPDTHAASSQRLEYQKWATMLSAIPRGSSKEDVLDLLTGAPPWQ